MTPLQARLQQQRLAWRVLSCPRAAMAAGAMGATPTAPSLMTPNITNFQVVSGNNNPNECVAAHRQNQSGAYVGSAVGEGSSHVNTVPLAPASASGCADRSGAGPGAAEGTEEDVAAAQEALAASEAAERARIAHLISAAHPGSPADLDVASAAVSDPHLVTHARAQPIRGHHCPR